jgi:hypothetical protein
MNYPPPESEDGDEGFDIFKIYHKDGVGYIKLEYEDWKWYETYPFIKWLESLWEFWKDHDRLSGRRIRIGENDDDTEVDDFGDHYLEIYVSRTIDTNECMHGEKLINKEKENGNEDDNLGREGHAGKADDAARQPDAA